MTFQQSFNALITKLQTNFTWLKNNKADSSHTHSYNDLTNKPTIPSPVTVDSALSTTSENPVQNKVINSALGDKLDKSGGTMTGALHVGNSAQIETNGYITATWFKTTSVTDNNDLTSVAMIDSNGWIYKQPKSTLLSGCQTTSNLVTTLSNECTDDQYPSAKCVYDAIDATGGAVDGVLSITSVNAVMNKVITEAFADISANINLEAYLDMIIAGTYSDLPVIIQSDYNNDLDNVIDGTYTAET